MKKPGKSEIVLILYSLMLNIFRKGNEMFEKHKSWVIAELVISLWSITTYANTINLTWHRVDGCTTSDSTITGWHTSGTNKLCQDDDGEGSADVSCNTVLNKSGSTDTGWTYEGGDDVIDDDTELRACLEAITRDCAAVTDIAGSKGACLSGKIVVADDAVSTTLVHEVGHKQGLSDLKPTVELRIMNYVANDSDCYVITSEKNEYEGL